MKKTMMIVLFLAVVCLLSACGMDNNPKQKPPKTVTYENSAIVETHGQPENTESSRSTTTTRISITAGDTVLNATIYDEHDIQKIAENGDLAYWFSGNSLTFFFNTENDAEVNSGIVVFGKITSDLSVFDNMSGSETVTVTLLE